MSAIHYGGWVAFIIALCVLWARAGFYRAYFFEKQRNMGNDPHAVLRREFPLIWWLM